MEWSERNSFSCVEPRRKHEKKCSLWNFLVFPHHSIFFTFRSTQDFLFYFFSTLFHMRKKKILVKLYFFDWVPHTEREREKIIVKMFFVFIWKKKILLKYIFFHSIPHRKHLFSPWHLKKKNSLVSAPMLWSLTLCIPFKRSRIKSEKSPSHHDTLVMQWPLQMVVSTGWHLGQPSFSRDTVWLMSWQGGSWKASGDGRHTVTHRGPANTSAEQCDPQHWSFSMHDVH